MKTSAASARRYARALLDVALQRADPAAVRKDLDAVAAVVAAQPELAGVLTHPAVPVDRKKKIVTAVWGDGLDALVRRLLDLLVERNRAELLPAIAREYASLWNAHRGVTEAEAVAAVSLDPAQASALARAIEQATGRPVELRTTVDPTVLGGVLLRMAGQVFDGTVTGRLRALKARIAGGARS